MVNIDFVPEEYVQQRQCCKANVMYLVLFTALMTAIVITFLVIKVRQKNIEAKLLFLNSNMVKAHEQFKQLEELQSKRKTMMKNLVMTAELLEPVPRSVILASLTNNLPSGVSLLSLKLEQKERKPDARTASASQYEQKANAAKTEVSKEQLIDTHIEIEGVAPSDIEVASYIARLSESILLDRVALVESREYEIEEAKFRRFELKAMLKRDILLTKEEIVGIRLNRQGTM